MAQLMLVKAHYGWVEYTSKGTGQTNVLFSVRDKLRVAYYTFMEENARFNTQHAADVGKNSKAGFGIAGTGNPGAFFTPRAKLAVADFANGQHKAPDTALSRTASKRSGAAFVMGITIFLKTGPENLEFEFGFSTAVPESPAANEWGIVARLSVEKFKGQSAVDKTALDLYRNATYLLPFKER